MHYIDVLPDIVYSFQDFTFYTQERSSEFLSVRIAFSQVSI